MANTASKPPSLGSLVQMQLRTPAPIRLGRGANWSEEEDNLIIKSIGGEKTQKVGDGIQQEIANQLPHRSRSGVRNRIAWLRKRGVLSRCRKSEPTGEKRMLIISMKDKGFSNPAIAEECGIPNPNSISAWLKKWRAEDDKQKRMKRLWGKGYKVK